MKLALEFFTRDADRGVFNPADASILAAEVENLGLKGVSFHLERVYTGCANCEDVRTLANALEIAYGRIT